VSFYIKNRCLGFLNALLLLHVYFCFGTALTGYAFYILLSNDNNPLVFWNIFLVSYSLHAVNKITDLKEDAINHPKRFKIVKRFYKLILISIIISLFLGLYLSWIAGIDVFLVTIFIIIVGIIYSVKILPRDFSKYRRMKDIPIGKTITIAIDWVLAIVIIPVSYISGDVFPAMLILSVFIFFRCVINSSLFDMRDIKGDKEQGVITIPAMIGEKKTIYLFALINTFLGGLIFASVLLGILPPLAHLINISTVLVYFYLYALTKPLINKRFLYELVIDGEYLLIGGVIIVPFILGVV